MGSLSQQLLRAKEDVDGRLLENESLALASQAAEKASSVLIDELNAALQMATSRASSDLLLAMLNNRPGRLDCPVDVTGTGRGGRVSTGRPLPLSAARGSGQLTVEVVPGDFPEVSLLKEKLIEMQLALAATQVEHTSLFKEHLHNHLNPVYDLPFCCRQVRRQRFPTCSRRDSATTARSRLFVPNCN